jgi:hypothetical protein
MEDKTLVQIKIQDESGSILDAQIEYYSPSWPDWILEFTSPITEKLSFTEVDVFECLTQLRLELAKYGYKPLCAGARLDVYPSGMARDMGSGLSAQVMSGKPATSWEDVKHVYIFDYCEPDSIASVEEQFNYYGSRFGGSYDFKIQHQDDSVVIGLVHQNPVLEPNKIKFTSSIAPDIEVYGENEFECLKNLWIELDKHGYKPLCNGARFDTYPLPDDIEVLRGMYVHVLAPGKLPDRENLDRLRTFEYAESHLITSIAEQRNNYEAWLDSIKYVDRAEYEEYLSRYNI